MLIKGIGGVDGLEITGVSLSEKMGGALKLRGKEEENGEREAEKRRGNYGAKGKDALKYDGA